MGISKSTDKSAASGLDWDSIRTILDYQDWRDEWDMDMGKPIREFKETIVADGSDGDDISPRRFKVIAKEAEARGYHAERAMFDLIVIEQDNPDFKAEE